jgi:hypothetical protein|tara:strand:- start:804 stop:1040 length:237 start_codon:yes stop_codon:yes gene_type:complete
MTKSWWGRRFDSEHEGGSIGRFNSRFTTYNHPTSTFEKQPKPEKPVKRNLKVLIGPETTKKRSKKKTIKPVRAMRPPT